MQVKKNENIAKLDANVSQCSNIHVHKMLVFTSEKSTIRSLYIPNTAGVSFLSFLFFFQNKKIPSSYLLLNENPFLSPYVFRFTRQADRSH